MGHGVNAPQNLIFWSVFGRVQAGQGRFLCLFFLRRFGVFLPAVKYTGSCSVGLCSISCPICRYMVQWKYVLRLFPENEVIA